MKDKTTALILSILLGGLGIDRFYLGYTGIGVLKLLTAGCFGILWIVDIINILNGSLGPADGSEYGTGDLGTSPSRPTSNGYDNLEKIAKLHDQGVLSDEEFQKMKSTILSKLL